MVNQNVENRSSFHSLNRDERRDQFVEIDVIREQKKRKSSERKWKGKRSERSASYRRSRRRHARVEKAEIGGRVCKEHEYS